MRILLGGLICLAASFALVSCGGAVDGLIASPFAGHFTGTWTEDGPDVGTADVTINSNGNVGGTYVDTTASVTGTVSGTILGDGTTILTITFTGHPNINETGSWALTNNNNTLSGSLVNSGPNTNTVAYVLTRQ